jgi:hypothetical protein
MKKVVSFCLYKAPEKWEEVMNTNFNKYIVGLEENINLVQKYYPGWFVYLYHNEEFDITKIEHLRKFEKFETKLITDKSLNAMQWRFLPNDDEDVELFIVRDSDSRITEREQVSVNEWIDSGKILHIMRDHPHHTYSILGGMWGMRNQKDFSITQSCIDYNLSNNYNSEIHWYEKWWDMNFLRDIIYPKYIDNSYINSETGHGSESWSRPFTKDRDDRKFVGEIYIDKDNRDYHYKLL